jgi:hypothetical protein
MQDILKNKKIMGIIGGVLVFIILIGGIRSYNSSKKAKQAAELEAQKAQQTDITKVDLKSLSDFDKEQIRWIERYGTPPKGFRWKDDGTLQALGDPNLKDTDVAYTYIRALSTLDIATAQKYSNKTNVITSLNRYYSTEADFTYDENFKKDMFKQVLLSIKPVKITNVANFANFRNALTMKIEVTDLTNKDFWKKDSSKIFKDLKEYKKTEQDTTKAKNYLYKYVLDYYKSEKPAKHEVEINLVLDQDKTSGGWIVVKDKDLDNIAKYADGELVVNNILAAYDEWLSKETR